MSNVEIRDAELQPLRDLFNTVLAMAVDPEVPECYRMELIRHQLAIGALDVRVGEALGCYTSRKGMKP